MERTLICAVVAAVLGASLSACGSGMRMPSESTMKATPAQRSPTATAYHDVSDIGTPQIQQHPIDVAVDPTAHNTFLSVQSDGGGYVDVISDVTKSVTDPISIGEYPNSVIPSGIAVDPTSRTIFVVALDESSKDNVMTIDEATHAVGPSIPLGDDVAGDAGDVAVDSKAGRIYVTRPGSDSVSVISEATKKVVATVPARVGHPDDIAVDQNTGTVYVAGGSNVSAIKEGTNKVTAVVPVGNGAKGVTVDPSTAKVYADSATGLSVISESTNKVVKDLPGFSGGLATDPATKTLFVGAPGENQLAAIDETTDKVVGTVGVKGHDAVAANPATNTTYTVNSAYGAVSLIQP